MDGFDIGSDTPIPPPITDFSSESSGESIPILLVMCGSDTDDCILSVFFAKSTGELIPIITQLVMGGSETGTDTQSRVNESEIAASPWAAPILVK